jgi:Glycoside hydrolase 123, catalytic domain
VQIEVNSFLKEHIRLREVLLVPSNYPCHPMVDDGYLRTAPGMYPDLLRDVKENRIKLIRGQWRSIWIDVEITQAILEGDYSIELNFVPENGQTVSVEAKVQVIGTPLKELPIKHTEWFHADCIADYYHIPILSEKHWEYMENFIEIAAKRDCNMMLTPIFTPPLDTAKGGERTTIQLIDIEVKSGSYEFDFTKLKRFIALCQKHGIKYFEMSHLFTQWGAIAAPKIMARKDGELIKLFGWHTPATGEEYQAFLHVFLPALIQELKAIGIQENTFFHISDEPSLEQAESYEQAVNSVAELLKDFQIIDALSDYDFYERGFVKQPVCATNHIDKFIENDVPMLWSYYCTAQGISVSNRFMAMPSARNRIYGMQVYKYNITGILHWGFNFYNSEFSLEHINPYEVTDCDCAFPSGDAFLVYPGTDGKPEESIRLMVHYEAMTDIRACKLLEDLKGKEYVLQIIEDNQKQPITFDEYTCSAQYLISTRNRINREIKKTMDEVAKC